MRASSFLFWFCISIAGALLLVLGRHAHQEKKPADPAVQAPQKRTEADRSPGTKRPPAQPAQVHGGGDPDLPVVLAAATGGAVPGAVIRLCEEGPGDWVEVMGTCVFRTSAKVLWQTRAGDQGTFAWPGDITEGSYLLSVRAEGFAPYERRIESPLKLPKDGIRLEAGGRLLATGLAAPGIPVVIAAPWGHVALGNTDARGEALFSDLHPGSYAVLIGDPQSDAIVRNLASENRLKPRYEREVKAGTVTRVDLAAAKAELANVKGRVIGAEEGGITLRSLGDAAHLSRSHELARDGTFSFPFVPPGTYELVVTPALGRAHVVEINLEKGDRQIEFSFPLATIQGVVYRPDGDTPVADAEVHLAPEDGLGELMAATDAQGTFAFTGLVPGAYRLTVGGAAGKGPPVTRQVFAGDTTPAAMLRIAYPTGEK